MTTQNAHELSHNELDAVTGGEVQVGQAVRAAICPNCLCNLEQGTFTRPEWEEYNTTLKKNIPIYEEGFICPKCGYNALFKELPYYIYTKDGFKPIS